MKISKSHLLAYTAIFVLLLTFIGYPLVAPVSILLNIPNRFISVPFRAMVLLFSLIVILRVFLLRVRFPSGFFWLAWWIFWGLYISRIIIDGFMNPEVLRLSLAEYLLYAIGMSMLPAVALSINLSNSLLNRALILIIVLGALAALFNLWMITSHRAIVEVAELTAGRQKSDTLNPIALSHLGVTVAILSAWMLVRAQTRGLLKLLALLACAFIGVGTALAGASRGPLLVLALCLPMLVYTGVRSLSVKKNLLRLSVITGVVLVGLVWVLMNLETILALRRIQESMFEDSVRFRLYTDGLKLFLENPLLGGGTEPLGFYPHNAILESFMMYGVFSGLLFVTLMMISFYAVIKIFFAYQQSSWISLLYVQYLIGAMVSGGLYFDASMWVIMVLAVSQLAVLRIEASAGKCLQPPGDDYDLKQAY